jgi:aromatic ring-opening dioxygenase catalytic subunit (LigB family)
MDASMRKEGDRTIMIFVTGVRVHPFMKLGTNRESHPPKNRHHQEWHQTDANYWISVRARVHLCDEGKEIQAGTIRFCKWFAFIYGRFSATTV